MNDLELNLISRICKRILKNCYCPSSENNLMEVMSKLETYLNNCTDESINNSEVNLKTNIIQYTFKQEYYLGFRFNQGNCTVLSMQM